MADPSQPGSQQRNVFLRPRSGRRWRPGPPKDAPPEEQPFFPWQITATARGLLFALEVVGLGFVVKYYILVRQQNQGYSDRQAQAGAARYLSQNGEVMWQDSSSERSKADYFDGGIAVGAYALGAIINLCYTVGAVTGIYRGGGWDSWFFDFVMVVLCFAGAAIKLNAEWEGTDEEREARDPWPNARNTMIALLFAAAVVHMISLLVGCVGCCVSGWTGGAKSTTTRRTGSQANNNDPEAGGRRPATPPPPYSMGDGRSPYAERDWEGYELADLRGGQTDTAAPAGGQGR